MGRGKICVALFVPTNSRTRIPTCLVRVPTVSPLKNKGPANFTGPKIEAERLQKIDPLAGFFPQLVGPNPSDVKKCYRWQVLKSMVTEDQIDGDEPLGAGRKRRRLNVAGSPEFLAH